MYARIRRHAGMCMDSSLAHLCAELHSNSQEYLYQMVCVSVLTFVDLSVEPPIKVLVLPGPDLADICLRRAESCSHA